MAFRARINPASLARRVPVRTAAPPSSFLAVGHGVASTPGQAKAGPGPSTLAFARSYHSSREYHSSPPARDIASFLGLRKKAPPASPVDELLSAAEAGAPDLPMRWRAYRKSLGNSPPSRPLTAEESLMVLNATEGLIGQADPNELYFLAKHCYWDYEKAAAHHRALVRIVAATMVLPAHAATCLVVARDHAQDMGRPEWDAVIRVAVNDRARWKVVSKVIPRDDYTFSVIVAAREYETKEDVDNLVTAMLRRELPLGPWTEVALVKAYSGVGAHDEASSYIARWAEEERGEGEAERDEKLVVARWNARLSAAKSRGDALTVRDLIRDHDEAPGDILSFLVLDSLPVTSALSSAEVVAAIRKLEDEVGYSLPSAAWDDIFHALIDHDLRCVWELYDHARHVDGVPSEALATALIGHLTSLKPPMFDEALDVYTHRMTRSDSPPSNGEVYTDLLTASLEVPWSKAVHEAVFSQILHDMAASRQRLSAPFAYSLVRSLWQHAEDHPVAAEMFDAVLVTSEPLSRGQWEELIVAFIRLSFPSSAVPTPDLLVRMIGNMRSAGHAPAAGILTALLTSYADLAKVVRRYDGGRAAGEVHVELLEATRNVQSLLNLDAALEINISLLTALMDAYQSCGAFDDALQVWAEIVRRFAPSADATQDGQLWDLTVGVIIDACGFAGQPGRGERIWSFARKRGLISSAKGWTAYIEMLARCEQFDRAVDALALMDKEAANGGPQPTLGLIMIPLKFSRGAEGRVQHVRGRLIEALPRWEKEIFQATAEWVGEDHTGSSIEAKP